MGNGRKRVLVCGPWVGEIGIFLMWLGGCRYRAQHGNYDKVVVIGPKGWGILVADFADEYVAHPWAVSVLVGHTARRGMPTKEQIADFIHESVPTGEIDLFPPVDTHPVESHPGNTFREPIGKKVAYVKYGTPRAELQGSIVLHARWRQDWGQGRNWPPEKWADLIGKFKLADPSQRIVCIGSREGAMLVNGCEDKRGVPVAELCDILRSATLVVGPSSGPMHLASLCDAPHVTWVGYSGTKRNVLVERYTKEWRPHGTPVACIEHEEWRPDANTVYACCKHMLNGGGERRAKRQAPRPVIAVAVLCYGGLADTQAAVQSIREHTKLPCEVIVVDNSDDWEHAHWLAEHDPAATYIRMGANTGCTKPRNIVARYCWARGYPYFVFMDQDVEIVGDQWLVDMVFVAEKHADTGAVGWPLANAVEPEYPVGPAGEVRELPGMCTLYRTKAALECPWDERFFAYRFDTWWHLLAGEKGWKTRIVRGKGNKIKHEHPHSGVNRNPHMDDIRRRSEALFQQLLAEHDIPNPLLVRAEA